MKKLFTLIAAALLAVSANAKTEYQTSWASFGAWASTCTVSDWSISFSAQWAGCGWWFGTLSDAPTNPYWILEVEGTTDYNVFLQRSALEGEEGMQNTIVVSCDKNTTLIGLPIEDNAVQMCIQSTSTTAGSLTINHIYLGTKEEYEEMKEAAGTPDKELSLDNLGSGWGDSSYDATTHTITIGDDWSGKGWYFTDADYSDYNSVTIEFDPATTANGKVVIEYADGTNNGDEGLFEAGTTSITCALSSSKDHVKQIYIQGPAGTTYTLAAAYLSATATGINTVKAAKVAEDGVYYNLSGQRVAKPSKGLYIQNGKKVIVK